ncbi:MAG: deoxyribonuclease IV [candidate division KSB1 bacterium]|nr:deoxyribonuclease IV [candidate division KSB1 bacterium]
MLLLGAHVSIAGGLARALERAEQIGCTVAQIFTKNQLQWYGKPLAISEQNSFADALSQSTVTMVLAHAGYLINLASNEKELIERSCHALIEELDRAQALKIPYLILHPGAHKGIGEHEGLKRIVESLQFVFSQRISGGPRLLLETTAGQGTNLGYRFDQLRWIMDQIKLPDRLGVCLDTCHAFAAGYDFRTEERYEDTIAEFDQVIGLKNLYVIHVNDSLQALGSRIDRHENIGLGYIGIEGFKFIMNDPRFHHTPKLLETPGGLSQFRLNIEILRSLVSVSGT